MKRWLPHLFGLAKSDGAVLFNTHLEAIAFQTRLKASPTHLPPEQDDLGAACHRVTVLRPMPRIP